MAKAKRSNAIAYDGPSAADKRRWEVEDAMRTLQRAGEIVADKKLMEDVKACAEEEIDEMKAVAKQANALAKAGRISPKQLAKLGAR